MKASMMDEAASESQAQELIQVRKNAMEYI